MRPSAELCQPELAEEFARSLTLAHLDAYLREEAQALAFLRMQVQRRPGDTRGEGQRDSSGHGSSPRLSLPDQMRPSSAVGAS